MHVHMIHVWEHISQPLNTEYRTMDVYEVLGRDEVAHGPLQVLLSYSLDPSRGGFQGGAKIGHRGSPSSTELLMLQHLEGYSNKPNA